MVDVHELLKKLMRQEAEIKRLRAGYDAIRQITGVSQPRPWTALCQIDTLVQKVTTCP